MFIIFTISRNTVPLNEVPEIQFSMNKIVFQKYSFQWPLYPSLTQVLRQISAFLIELLFQFKKFYFRSWQFRLIRGEERGWYPSRVLRSWMLRSLRRKPDVPCDGTVLRRTKSTSGAICCSADDTERQKMGWHHSSWLNCPDAHPKALHRARKRKSLKK